MPCLQPIRLAASVAVMALIALSLPAFAVASAPNRYAELLALHGEWRTFLYPALTDGVPDYTRATMERRRRVLRAFQQRLAAFAPGGWTVPQRIDLELLRAEMNGLDFDLRVLQPWARDPAFYASLATEQSDTPAHEGPTHDALIELWQYSFPLDAAARGKLAAQLRAIAPLLAQARLNLTGNARDLWSAGTGTMQVELGELGALRRRLAGGESDAELAAALERAERATAEFVDWLVARAPSKTGPSGVGKDNYSWSQRHVHLVPLAWDEEVAILKRELARAHAALRLEEHHNRALPPLTAIAGAEEYRQRANAAVSRYIAFLRDRDILDIRDFHDPAMRAHIGEFVPQEKRNFFVIASHYEPLALFTHFYHWFDHAYMTYEPNPSPLRREPLPFNIWDSRAEGMATAVEEMMMHAGLYDENPRAREVVWIMLAQRCARGLASLYAQANLFDLKQAKDFQVKWTPRGWMRPDLDLLGFEQQLYLRQPGYGTSYVTGKYLIDELIKDRSAELGADFSLKRFLAEFNAAGLIPVSLIHWQLAGGGDRAPQPAAGR